MENVPSTQHALQVALETMKERCKQLQKRVNTLEDENLNLRIKCSEIRDETSSSLEELDVLRAKVTRLTEEKAQLRNNVTIVAAENRQLWARLSKLTNDNKSLGSKLTKINDSITQHTTGHSPLIRSKTFTQEAPQTKHLQRVLVENDEISLELEDISLKLFNSISKEKCELEMQCTEMTQLQEGVYLLDMPYIEDDADDFNNEEVEQHIKDLKLITSNLEAERENLQKAVQNIQEIKVQVCLNCKKKLQKVKEKDEAGDDVETKLHLDSLSEWGSSGPVKSINRHENKDLPPVKVCPMCNEIFPDNDFDALEQHVENHFRS